MSLNISTPFFRIKGRTVSQKSFIANMGNSGSRSKEMERSRWSNILVSVCEKHKLERRQWEAEKVRLLTEIAVLREAQPPPPYSVL